MLCRIGPDGRRPTSTANRAATTMWHDHRESASTWHCQEPQLLSMTDSIYSHRAPQRAAVTLRSQAIAEQAATHLSCPLYSRGSGGPLCRCMAGGASLQADSVRLHQGLVSCPRADNGRHLHGAWQFHHLTRQCVPLLESWTSAWTHRHQHTATRARASAAAQASHHATKILTSASGTITLLYFSI
jgi:hypothetical protein